MNKKEALEMVKNSCYELENISEISEAGADTFVAGSAIFSQNNYEKVISEMRSSIK